jgi:hypothetical protein
MKIEFIHIDGKGEAHNVTPEPCRMEVTEHQKTEWSRMATKCYATGHNALGTRMSVAATLRRGETMALRQWDSLMDAYRAWLCFDEYDDDDPAQIVLPGAEKTTPREMLQRKAAARPIPKNGQEVLPAGGLFDPRGPAPLQTKLFTED